MENRVRDLREKKGWKQADLAELIGVQWQTISRIENQRTRIMPKRETALADALGVSIGELYSAATSNDNEPSGLSLPASEAGEITPSNAPFVMAPIVGITEAGSFRVVEDFDQDEPEFYPVPKDTRFPNARVMVFEVSGDSMNALDTLPLKAGALAVCVAYEDVAHKFPMRDGIVVVVERRRDGGHLREWSIKQVELHDEHVEFWPRSTNPAHKPITVPRDSLADDGAEVEVIGLVRSVIFRAPDF